ncbi:MAG: UvrD-helicase domain-containing protein [Fimbriimonadaceae bacterium]|nr:UvrD-helicase domain-containing protein [Fimbriimonadaceae bacterium]
MSLIFSDEQRAIIDSRVPKLLVRAGAGAGKTTVLTERYFSLVTDRGMRPDQVLTITFTRKAAAEMKGRIVNRLKDTGHSEIAQMAETGPIQTIDSFCERVLRENALAAGLDPGFEVLTGQLESIRRRTLLQQIVDEQIDADEMVEAFVDRNLDLRKFEGGRMREYFFSMLLDLMNAIRSSALPRSFYRDLIKDKTVIRASWQKEWERSHPRELEVFDQLMTSDAGEDAAISTLSALRIAIEAADRYDADLKNSQELDFALMASWAVQLIRERPDVEERLADQYRVAMVDEAQDLSPIQHSLVDALPVEEMLYVGDAQQSIFGFRGAISERFVELESSCMTLPLSRNYRSTPDLQRFFDRLFASKWGERYLPMNPDRAPSDDPFALGSVSGLELWEVGKNESLEDSIAQGIEQLGEDGIKWGDMIVLAPNAWDIEAIGVALAKRNIPHRRSRGTKFYLRQEVRDVANLLAAAAEPRNDFAMLAMLRSPFVDLTLDSIAILAAAGDVLALLDSWEAPYEHDRARIELLQTWWPELVSRADRLTAWEVLAEAFAKSPYLVNIASRPRAEEILANVRKLQMRAAEDPVMDAGRFAELINQTEDFAIKEKDADTLDAEADAVTVMTFHHAKGLGAKCVITVLPKNRTSLDVLYVSQDGSVIVVDTNKSDVIKRLRTRQNQLDEAEKERLVYVALTRAKERLAIVHSEKDANRVWANEVRFSLQGLEGLKVRTFKPVPDAGPSVH